MTHPLSSTVDSHRETTFTSYQIKGRGIGRRSLFPTINLAVPDHISLTHGIYGAWLSLKYQDNAMRFPCALHFGPRPVFHDPSISLEAYCIDADHLDEGYDRDRIVIQTVGYVRSIRDFPSVESLRSQIEYDIDTVRSLLGISHL